MVSTRNENEDGKVINLTCSLESSIALMTDFVWNIESASDVSHHVKNNLRLMVNRNDTGNYTCKTNDTFGSLMKTIFLDVHCEFSKSLFVIQNAFYSTSFSRLI